MLAVVEVRLVDPAVADVHDVLRDLLGAPPARTAEGKPFLPGSSQRFSVTHTHGLGAIALTDDIEVGVDLEPLDGPRRRRVLPGVLSDLERARVGDDVGAFLRCWTRKEALLKAVGTGLTGDLRKVGLTPAGDGRWVPETPMDGAWAVVDLAVAGYAGAVAVAADGVQLTVTTA